MTSKTKGILLILLSAFSFSMMNVLIPLAPNLPTLQKSFFRNSISFIVATILLLKDKKQNKTFVSKETPNVFMPLFLRSLLGTLGILFNFYALDHLPVSNATVIIKIAPFATLLFSALFLKEYIQKHHVLACIIAFLGVLFIARPTFQSNVFIPYLIAIAAGLCAGGAYTCLRHLNRQNVAASFIVAFFSGFSTITLLPFLLVDFKVMTLMDTVILISAGLFASIGQFAITYAYKFAPAKDISIFDYSGVLFTGLLGYVLLNQTIDFISAIGYLIIFSASLLSFLYEHRN